MDTHPDGSASATAPQPAPPERGARATCKNNNRIGAAPRGSSRASVAEPSAESHAQMDIRGFFAKPKGAASDQAKGKRKLDEAAPSAATPGSVAPSEPKKAVKQNISPDDFFSMSFTAKPSPAAGTPASTTPTTASGPSSASPAAAPAKQSRSPAKKSPAGKRKLEEPPKQPPSVDLTADDEPAKPSPAKAKGAKAKAAKPKAAKASPKESGEKAPPAPDAEAPAAAPTPAPRKWYPGMKDDAPPNKGLKPVPEGKAGCLAGQIIVITGTQDSLEREEAQALIEKYGGKVTGSVSKKTSCLLLGMDPTTGAPFEGSKARKARELGTRIIDEDALFDMIRESMPQKKTPAPSPPKAEKSPKAAKKSPKASPGGGTKAEPKAEAAPAKSPAKPPPKREAPPPAAKEPAAAAAPLWVEKYRPSSIAHLAGNADHVRRLQQWLSTWHGSMRAAAERAPAKGEKGFVKAALLSGPPGVGKTSAAKVVLRECGYDVVEFNASDTRSQKALKELVSDLVDNRSIADFATKGGSGLARAAAGQMALVMDEVDGMSSGDRGGMAQLIALIKAAKLPVVCICNDRSDAKVRSLANHCLDLRFRRPGPREVCDVLRRVASAEGYTVDDATLERVAGACNADIRQMLNLLQMWQPKDSSRLADGGMVSTMSSTFKDVKVGPFDVAEKFFREPNTPLDERLRHYFVDSSMVPLMVQDIYLTTSAQGLRSVNPQQQQLEAIHRAMHASEAIADADLVGTRILRDQSWGLAPLHGVLSCVSPGFKAATPGGVRVQFPSWLGRNSTRNKRMRLLREAASHAAGRVSASQESVRTAYIPALRGPLLAPLKQISAQISAPSRPYLGVISQSGVGGVDETLALMDAYSLTKDDFDSIMELQLLHSSAPKPDISSVPTNVKSALTRAYNKSHGSDVQKKSSTKGGVARERFTEADGSDDGEMESEEEEEEEKVVPKAAAKGKGKGKAKAK